MQPRYEPDKTTIKDTDRLIMQFDELDLYVGLDDILICVTAWRTFTLVSESDGDWKHVPDGYEPRVRAIWAMSCL